LNQKQISSEIKTETAIFNFQIIEEHPSMIISNQPKIGSWEGLLTRQGASL